MLYVAYRWTLVLYFFIWLIMAGKGQGNGKYFIFLTNWAHLSYNFYLIIAAVSTTTKSITNHCAKRHKEPSHSRDYFTVAEPDDYWNISKNRLSWYQMVHWVYFTIGNELAFGIMVLYWSLIYRGGNIDGISANTHLLNGILSLADVWISGLPVNFLHVVYLLIFGTVYNIFSGVYFISTGENIYGVLDYKNNTGSAVGLYLALTFLLLPFLHLCVYLMYLGRQWVVYRVCAVRQAKWSGLSSDSEPEGGGDHDHELQAGRSLELTDINEDRT